MIHKLLTGFIAACVIALPCAAAPAKPASSQRCHRTQDPVKCFVDLAKAKLARVANGNERADAIGELLYTLSATQSRDDALAKAAAELAASGSVRGIKQMDLLYALDIYASAIPGDAADQTFRAALRQFATLEQELKGNARVELYVNACSIITWDDRSRERWLEFSKRVCTPEKLQATKPDAVGYQALVLAMMPVAMTLAENPEGFAKSADQALSWLDAAEAVAAKSKKSSEKDFVGFMGVLMHTMNSLCLEAFDEADAADAEVDAALKALRRAEKRVGISGRSTNLRRQVVEALFNTGREPEAKKMLGQMLARVDADSAGRSIAFGEQVSILLLAAKFEYDEKLDSQRTCIPEGSVET